MVKTLRQGERKTAARLGTLTELARINVSDEEVANLDEPGLRLFALNVMILHWHGAKNVVVDKCGCAASCASL